MSANILRLPVVPRRPAPHAFVEPNRGERKWCAVNGCGRPSLLHSVKRVPCSSCGGEFKPRDISNAYGFSACTEHSR